jgi:ABC-2 type transport system ATP-binding protein
MDEAEYCNRVAIMSEGKIVALDTPAALKAKFQTESMDGVFLKIARNKE